LCQNSGANLYAWPESGKVAQERQRAKEREINDNEELLKKFQEKHPKLADGIVKNPRALRKLINQAQKTKAILSANKAAPFIVESLFEDTDFQATLKREEFEEMCKDMFAGLTPPIQKALDIANVTMQDIKQVEVVGGGWRVPKVQAILSDFIEQSAGKKLPLGQHLNGEEAAALGSVLVGANSSSSFRVKKIFFTDITTHSYSIQVSSAVAGEKNMTTLYPVGAPLGGKKKLSFALEEDFVIKLFEDGVLISEYAVTGLAEKLSGSWKEYNLTGTPKVSVNVNLESSGLIEVKNAVATVEELYWVNVTKEKKKAPSPFGDQPEVSEPEFSIFERPRDFQGDAGGLPEQWDKYAGGSAIGPSRNFEGPSWERAYKEWEKKGIPRPSTTQKLGYTSGPAGYSRPANKAYVDYESRRPDYSEGPKFRGKPKVTENYKNPRPDLKADDKK